MCYIYGDLLCWLYGFTTGLLKVAVDLFVDLQCIYIYMGLNGFRLFVV